MRSSLTLTAILTLAACGPSESDTTEGSGDTGTATAAATDAPTTGEPLSCDIFLPPPAEAFQRVEVSITNKLAEPVWFDALGCGGFPLLRVLDAGAVDIFELPSECSPQECHEFLGRDDCTLGCNDCGAATARRLGPGDTFAVNWSAARGVPMQMTAACAPGSNCQRECLRPEPLAAGSYSVELTAFRGCTGACECDLPPEFTSCALWEPITTSEPFTVKVSLSYPEVNAIELVLE